jgi:16S rRNA processing protein RimM
MSEKRIIGNIAGYHGVRGEIKIYPLLDDLGCFYDFDELEIDDKTFKVNSVRNHKDFILVTLEGVNSLNDAELLKGHVKADFNEELLDDEIYIEDLISMPVRDQDDKEVGVIKNYYSSGQNLIGIEAVKELKCKREILVPYVEEFILEVNKEDGFIRVKLDEDLLELAQ